MQRFDLRMEEVTTAKCLGNRSESINLPIEFNGQAVALAEIAIEIGNWTRLPLATTTWPEAVLQERYCSYEKTFLAA